MAYRTLERLLASVRALVILQHMFITKTSLAHIANKILLLILFLYCLRTDGWRSCLRINSRSWRWFDVELGYTLQRALLVNDRFCAQRLILGRFSLSSATFFAARHIVVVVIIIMIIIVVVAVDAAAGGGNAEALRRGIAGSAESRRYYGRYMNGGGRRRSGRLLSSPIWRVHEKILIEERRSRG